MDLTLEAHYTRKQQQQSGSSDDEEEEIKEAEEEELADESEAKYQEELRKKERRKAKTNLGERLSTKLLDTLRDSLPTHPPAPPLSPRPNEAAKPAARPFDFHKSQKSSAQAMLEKIDRSVAGLDLNQYDRFEFVIMVPNLDTLRSQTTERVKGMVECLRGHANPAAESFANRVVAEGVVFKADLSSEKVVNKLRFRIRNQPRTLFLLIVDEAHAWAGKAGESAFDLFVNGPFPKERSGAVKNNQIVRRSANAITLFVSATPYSLQTTLSQVPASNEHDMLSDHTSSPPCGISYYGLEEYIERSRHLASSPNLKFRGGYITVDDHFEARVLANIQSLKAELDATAFSGNMDDFIRTTSRGKALIEEYQAAMEHWCLTNDPGAASSSVTASTDAASCSELTLRLISDLLGDRRAMILLRVKDVDGDAQQGRTVYAALCLMQKQLGLVNSFAIILATSGEIAQENGIKAALHDRHPELLKSLKREGNVLDTIEELQGIPCIYIVCETGRMGDTFPKSMLHYDLRLRYDHSDAPRASFEQDLGRAFRYARSDVDVLPTVILGHKGFEQVMKPEGLREAKPDSNMRRGVSSDARTQHTQLYATGTLLVPAVPPVSQANAMKGSSADYRTNFEPTERHFDHKHAGEVDPEWRDNPRRFLLIGRPQIGKTGVFLWLVWLLWQRLNASSTGSALAETVVDVFDLEEFTEEDDEVDDVPAPGGNKFPALNIVANQKFQHPPKEAGGYGDLKDTGMWEHYIGRYEAGGTSPLPKPPPYKAGEGFKRRGEVSSAPSLSSHTVEPTSETPTAGSKRTLAGETANKEELRVRWLSRGPKAPITRIAWDETPAEQKNKLLQRRELDIKMQVDLTRIRGLPERMVCGLDEDVRAAAQLAGGNVGTLHLTAPSVERDWVSSNGSPGGALYRLKYFDPQDEDVAASRLCFPILTPSCGRASEAFLDLSATMVDIVGTPKEYVQIVCVKAHEKDWYMANWPEHNFFVMPTWADALGVGEHCFCLKRLAEVICPAEYRYCLMIDDNVLNWVGITLVDDTECLFGGTIPTGRKATCRKLNRPMWEALSYLQDREFAHLERFALLGFQRLGNPKYHNHLTAPFVRSHVYKCYLLNLNRLEERDYDGAVWAVEDVDSTSGSSAIASLPWAEVPASFVSPLPGHRRSVAIPGVRMHRGQARSSARSVASASMARS